MSFLLLLLFALMSFISPDPHFSQDPEQSWCCHALHFTDDTHQNAWCRDARPKEVQGLRISCLLAPPVLCVA